MPSPDRSTMRAEAVGQMTAREEAIEAMAKAYYDWACLIETDRSRWDEPEADGGFPHKNFARARAIPMLDALLSPQSGSPCSECHGHGFTGYQLRNGGALLPKPQSTWARCTAPGCKDGLVSSPPLAVLMGELEQVGWIDKYDRLDASSLVGTAPRRRVYVRSGEDT